jgi:hypothetical protein
MLDAKTAREDVKKANEDNLSPVILQFESWVVEQSNLGFFNGHLPVEEYNFSAKNLGYLDKLGYKIVLDADSRMWKINW